MDGTPLETSYNLTHYGIFNEESDIRAHVTDGIVYVFKTDECINALMMNDFNKSYAYQPGCDIPTALGYLVPPGEIYDIRKLRFESWKGWALFKKDWDTSKKGEWAVNCVIDLIKIGRFPFWIDVSKNMNSKIDIEGTDILICMNKRIQVKCDYPAIQTKNLFIQTHERNPFKKH